MEVRHRDAMLALRRPGERSRRRGAPKTGCRRWFVGAAWAASSLLYGAEAVPAAPADAVELVAAAAKGGDNRTFEDVVQENLRLRLELERLRRNASVAVAPVPAVPPPPAAKPEAGPPGDPIGKLIYKFKHAEEEAEPLDRTWNPPKPLEVVELLFALMTLFVFSALPLVQPFRKCCATKLHRIYPLIVLLDIVAVIYVMDHLTSISFNQIFFVFVDLLEILINQVEAVLTGMTSLLMIAVAWKFKDRVLEAVGIDNPGVYIGECRDWFTCWSMRRFQPIEILIWKVEDIPAASLHTSNDLYVEATYGYNLNMRTRVHHKAGTGTVFKESLQLNFDPHDTNSRLHISVKSQGAIALNPEAVCKLTLGTQQVERLKRPPEERDLGWKAHTTMQGGQGLWTSNKFMRMDLIPAGAIWLKIADVAPPEEPGSCCCCP
eukprot:TRINITY_DN21236_c0_g1_i2.p1 TRINITY_DN21236_c0_g1~~TRINITY_DN21236_c0_g1_i2.p1  ORF type:complete len:434 (+),score=94.14 TRINITY_DN21236_c0_g1_i2:149-1450(+)